MRKARKSSGSIFLLGIILMGSVIWLFLMFFSFDGLMGQRSRSQDEIDSTTLSLAGAINASDRVGQINELEACSRELVFTSRKRVQECNTQDLDIAEPICQRLLIQAREGHRLIEAERQNQLQLICSEIQQAANKQNEAAKNRSGFSLAWLKTRAPIITQIDVGRIAEVDSNVKRSNALTELTNFDASQGFQNGQSKLFKADVNARLPFEDRDLDFMIAGLPALTGGTFSPARNVNPEVFVRTGTIFQDGISTASTLTQIPSAIQVTCSFDSTIGEKEKQSAKFTLISSGAASGGIAGDGTKR